MDRLEAMSVIVAVTETGSFSAASRRLKKPVATVSRKVAELEARLKAQLFQRSSRQMTLTDAGRSYIEACKRIIEQVDDAERAVSGEYRIPKGDLAVTAPWGLGHMHLVPIVVEFLDAYPEIALRLVLTDRSSIRSRKTSMSRSGSARSPDSSMIASRNRFGSDGALRISRYLAARGLPKEPADLAAIMIASALTAVRLSAPGSSQRMAAKSLAPIRSRLTVSDFEAAIDAAIAGAGIARVMSYKMEAARRAGTARRHAGGISSWSRGRSISSMPSESRCRSSSAPSSTG